MSGDRVPGRKPWRKDPAVVEITAATEIPDHFPAADALRAAGLRTYFDVFATPADVLATLPGVDRDSARELARLVRRS
jgi:hypothetical protein